MNLDWESEVNSWISSLYHMATAVFVPPGFTGTGLLTFCLAISDLVVKLMLSPMLVPVGRAGAAVSFTQGVSNWCTILREEGLGFSFFLVHLWGYDTLPANSWGTAVSASSSETWRGDVGSYWGERTRRLSGPGITQGRNTKFPKFQTMLQCIFWCFIWYHNCNKC